MQHRFSLTRVISSKFFGVMFRFHAYASVQGLSRVILEDIEFSAYVLLSVIIAARISRACRYLKRRHGLHSN